MDLNDWCKEAHSVAVSKGWHDNPDGPVERSVFRVAARLALIHSEISEALECLRTNQLKTEIIDGKPEGFDVEIADAVIRIFDLCGELGIDLESAVILKNTYNKSRPMRHGGKRL